MTQKEVKIKEEIRLMMAGSMEKRKGSTRNAFRKAGIIRVYY